MATIFDADFDIYSDGEFFWHATTIKNVLNMIRFDSTGLKPIGTGQLGAGFYLTGTRSDYQKAMARRARESDDAPLFLFYVRVKGFYLLVPGFLTQWDTKGVEGADFSAVCWYKEGQGAVGTVEKAGFMPSTTTGARTEFKYGEFRQEPMFGTVISNMPRDAKLEFLRTLWEYAQANHFPRFKDVERFGPIAMTLPMFGPRKTFTRILLELAIKSETCLASSAIVGVKIFSPTVEPVALKFRYGLKDYDLTSAVVDESELRTDENPLNFHDEVWLDLKTMVKILSV